MLPFYGSQYITSSGAGARFNPLSIPLLCIRFLVFLSLLGALIAASILPNKIENFVNEVERRWIDVRAAAIAIFSTALGFLLIQTILECTSCFAYYTVSRILSVLSNCLDLFFVLSVLGISVPLIAAEAYYSNNDAIGVNAIDRGGFLAAGILGLIASAFYILQLFFSRFYQAFSTGTSIIEGPIPVAGPIGVPFAPTILP